MRQLFNKEKQRAMIFPDLQTWSAEVCRIRDKLGRLTYCPPRAATMALAGLDPKQTICSQLQTDSDYAQFIAAVGKLTNVDDQEALLRILETEQPELSSNDMKVEISLLDLKPSTFLRAREFVKKKLRAQNIDYNGFWE
jgi:hypothetical protein